MSIQRFNIRRDIVWKAPLLIIGATEANSYVELRDEDLVARFGVHESRLGLSDIISAQTKEWPIWNGIGIRVGPGKRLGLVGSTEGVVELELKPDTHVKFLGITCTSLAFSLEDPQGFLEALQERQNG